MGLRDQRFLVLVIAVAAIGAVALIVAVGHWSN